MSRPLFMLALLTLLAPAGAAAQQVGAVTTVPPLTVSDTIRVVMRGSRRGFSGRFIAIDSTELRWLRTHDRARGFWIGAGVGVGVSLLGAAAAPPSWEPVRIERRD